MLSVAVLAGVVVIVIAADVIAPVPRGYVNRFLARYPVNMTVGNGPLVVRRLARVRAARTLGCVAGLVFTLVATLSGMRVNVLLVAAVGYLAGAIVAEYPARREREGAAAASLVPRRLDDYVPRQVVLAPLVIIAVTVALHVAGALGAHRADIAAAPATRAPLAIMAMVLAAAITYVTARMILYRAQPYTTGEMVSADDALRAAALHCVCGGGLAIVAMIGATSVWDIGVRSDVEVLRWVAPWSALLFSLIAWTAWFGIRVAPWLVRRPYETMVG